MKNKMELMESSNKLIKN